MSGFLEFGVPFSCGDIFQFFGDMSELVGLRSSKFDTENPLIKTHVLMYDSSLCAEAQEVFLQTVGQKSVRLFTHDRLVRARVLVYHLSVCDLQGLSFCGFVIFREPFDKAP